MFRPTLFLCRFALPLICGVAFSCRPAPIAAAETKKPNIILIYTDDVGLGDIGCCGGAFKTPRIDELAKSGTRFEYCYSTPLCGPSRCQTLTGRYPFRTGLINNQSHNAVDPAKEVMIPTVMRKAGYVTGSCGKWGQICLGPGEWGFDKWLVFPGSGKFWNDQPGGYDINGKHKELANDEYLPDTMHKWCVEFLEKHKDGPFFLYYPMSHCHAPILRTPDSKPNAGPAELYRDNIAYMDKLVGKLTDELTRLNLRDNTLVIFTCDNGTSRHGAGAATVDGKQISGQKGTMREGGSHVPLVVSWPGVTPAGKVNKDLIDFSDFFGTFAELGGATLPKGVQLDSHSFAAQIKGEKGTPREWVYVELDGRSFVRDARYKLTKGGELFDLKNAPWEEIPVTDSSDEAIVAVRKKLQTVLNEHPAGQPKEPRGKNKKKNKAG